ncbi:MAG TPA: TadE/TadG family type IV pilus assembly protein [Candidatus Sulfotelmatobacter sp.]|jgi:Flp pilus assembly protein TadG
MARSGRENWIRTASASCGQELAETALILPLLFMLLIGIYWFGMAFRIYGTITNAARDGARAAVNPGCTTCGASLDPTANAWTAIQNDMNAAHLNPALLAPPTTTPVLCSCAPGAASTKPCSTPTVSCDSNTNICVQGVSRAGSGDPPVEGLVQLSSTVAPTGLAGGGAGECGISVSFQYPFQFWLPFTSLSGRTVNLPAQAQMRAETQ